MKLPLPAAFETAVLPVSENEARTINAGMAFSTEPIEVARPFVLLSAPKKLSAGSIGETLNSRDLAQDCLTAAIYYEAASESAQGQRAVAQVVINRMRHPAFPKSICGVVYQGMERTTGCQFSFTCDGSLARQPSKIGWDRAKRIALAALDGAVEPMVGTATHYHTDWVVPYWASSLDKVTMIGAHIFYRWKGYWGHRAAFAGNYAGESRATIPVTMAYNSEADAPKDTAVTDSRIRLLADQIASVLPSQEVAVRSTPALRADEGRGRLAADQQTRLPDDLRRESATTP